MHVDLFINQSIHSPISFSLPFFPVFFQFRSSALSIYINLFHLPQCPSYNISLSPWTSIPLAHSTSSRTLLPLFLSLSLSLILSLSLSLSASLLMSLSASLSLYFYASLSHSLSPPLSLDLSLRLSLTIFLHLSLYL